MKTKLLFVLLMLFSITAQAQNTSTFQTVSNSHSWVSANGDSDFETIMSRLRNSEWSNSGSIADNDNIVSGLISSINTNGSWSNINYTNTAQTNWLPLVHLDQLKNMVLSYTMSTSKYYGDSILFSKISTALEFWYSSNPISTDWFYQQVRCPQRVGVILILMRSGKQKLSETLETNLLNRMVAIGGRPDQGGSLGSAANKVDIATHWVYRGCLTQDQTVLSFGVQQVYYPVFVTTGEGLQQDNSYFQHGAQFYTGGYGYAYINGITRIATFTKGTFYEMPNAKLNLLVSFARDAYFRLIRGKYFMYNSVGRGLSKSGGTRAGAIPLAELIKELDPANSGDYEALIKRISETESASYNMPTRQIHYWRGDYTLYYSPDYNFDIRMASTRTFRNENGNGENLKGYFLSEGAYGIAVNGDEYYNIFPVWDWAKVPGITAPQKTTIPKPSQWGTYGTSVFAGGVSNGLVGVTAFQLNNNEYSINTSAKKAWFMFGSEIVCLGASIKSTAAEDINTTINQCFLKTPVVMNADNQETTFSSGLHNLGATNVKWIHHNNVGYVFPQQTSLNLSNKTESGTWNSINSAASTNIVTNNVFKFWINHGNKPVDDKYAYILVPGVGIDKMRTHNVDNVKILANSDSVQVVKSSSQNTWGLVFYKPATFVCDDFEITTSGSCAIVIKNADTENVQVWLSDPSQTKKNIVIRYKSEILTNEKQVVLQLPQSPNAGSTVSFAINNQTNNYEPGGAVKKIYVDLSGSANSGNNDGTSWANAYQTLDAATAAANNNLAVDNVYIKGSVTTNTAWTMSNDNYYGSFAGTETDPSQRPMNDNDGNGIVEPWEFKYPTTLTFILNGSAINGSAAIMDGFTITHTGSVNSTTTMTTLTSPIGQTVQNCVFSGSLLSYGATTAFSASNGGCLLKVLGTFQNNLVESNKVTITAAADIKMCPILDVPFPSSGSVPVVVNACIFRNNNAILTQNYVTTTNSSLATRGMILNVSHTVNSSATVTFNNCVIHNNDAILIYATKQWNLAVASSSFNSTHTSSEIYINCLFANNRMNNSYGCMAVSGTTNSLGLRKVYNCAFWNNKNGSSLVNFRFAGAVLNTSVIANNITDGAVSGTPTNATYTNNLTNLSDINTTATFGPQFKSPVTFVGCVKLPASTDSLTLINHSDWRLNSGSYFAGKGSAEGTALILPLANRDKAGNSFAATPSVGPYEDDAAIISSTNDFFANKLIAVTSDGIIAQYQGILEVFAITGVVLKRIEVSNGQWVKLTQGTYVVRLTENGLSHTSKVIVL